MKKFALASMMASPREDNLKEVSHIFAFSKANHNSLMVFYPTEPDIYLSKFHREDCLETLYG